MQNITLREIPPPPPPPPAITTFTDERDGKTYNKVTIGGQTWMAQNLNYRGDDEDDPLGLCNNNRADSCAKYGRLYDWAAAMDGAASSSAVPSGVQGVCPAGWHLPSSAEWTALTDFVGGLETAGKKLKSTSGWGWEGNDGNGTDEYGFKALPGSSGNGINETGYNGNWWSATGIDNAPQASMRLMYHNSESVISLSRHKIELFSVRCVQNGAPPTGKKFTVAFNPDGGTPAAIASITVDSGAAIGASKLPPTPAKSGYTFGGWFSGSTQYTAATVIKAAVTLTAKWEAEIVTGSWTWSTYTDAGDKGTSSIGISESDGVISVSGNVTADYEYGYAGFKALPNAAELANLKTAKSISFDVKGGGKTYKIILPTSNVTDYCYYLYRFETTTAEKTVTVPIASFTQPGWGKPETFNQSLIESVSWETDDGVRGTFSLTISNLKLNQ